MELSLYKIRAMLFISMFIFLPSIHSQILKWYAVLVPVIKLF